MQTYDQWFQARIKRAMTDTRAPLMESKWQEVRAVKLVERKRLLSENQNPTNGLPQAAAQTETCPT